MDPQRINKVKKQSVLNTGRPVFLDNSTMELYFKKKSINQETKETRLGSLYSEMIEYTKPPHQRHPTLSIFGANVDHSIDQEDLHNLDLTMSQTNSMHEFVHEAATHQCIKHDDEMFAQITQEEDVVEIIKKRLSNLRKPYEPQEDIEGLADVLIWYKASRLDNTQMLLRAHSKVLSRHCNTFEELLETSMRDMTQREYLDRQFIRTRQFG
jgi:hypothetical protein